MITDDYQLMFEDYATGDMIILGDSSSVFCSVKFDGIGSSELRVSETEMSGEDGVTFGYEYLGKRPWTIIGAVKSGTNPNVGGDSSSAWDNLSQLMRAWDYNRARNTARAVVPLWFKRPGRETMLVYGRPDRIDPDVSQSYAGYVTYQASFRQSDPKFYSDAEQEITLPITTPYVGGLLYNGTQDGLILPFMTSEMTERQGVIEQFGDIDAPLIITFTGQVTNPTLRLLNSDGSDRWKIKLQTSVGSSQSVTIDTRMWQRTVLRNDGANIAGAVRGPRLAQLVAPPGASELIYSGASEGGSSTCSVRVRNAWAAI